MTEPTTSGVPATPVSGDVPADEPTATPPVAAAGEQVGEGEAPSGAADPATMPEPAPPAEPEPAPPAEPEPAPPAEPEPSPVAPPEPAPVVPPERPPVVPPEPAPVVPPAPSPPDEPPNEPPTEPPTEPAPPAVPEPVTPDPAPATPPPAEPAAPTETLDAGLAGAAATTTELAPHPAVPQTGEVYDDEPAARAPRRGVLLGAGAAALLLLVVGALLFTAGPVADWRAAQRLADRRADALNESRQLAINLVSIDYRNLDRDLERISSSTTGQARQEFDEKILQNESYKNLVRENEAVITSKIQRIGLEPCGTEDRECLRGDRAVVLVFLDQESKNKLRTTPRVDRNRVALTVVRRGDSWLVSEVKVV